jgi:hypothetical protein
MSSKFTVGLRARLQGDFAREARAKSCFLQGCPGFIDVSLINSDN